MGCGRSPRWEIRGQNFFQALHMSLILQNHCLRRLLPIECRGRMDRSGVVQQRRRFERSGSDDGGHVGRSGLAARAVTDCRGERGKFDLEIVGYAFRVPSQAGNHD